MAVFAYDNPLECHNNPLMALRFGLIACYGRRLGLLYYNLIIVKWYQDDYSDHLALLTNLSVNK